MSARLDLSGLALACVLVACAADDEGAGRGDAERPGDARVVAVTPGGPRLAANTLRVYVEFSAPMQRGWATEAIRLEDADGRAVEGAFLRIGHELWSPDMRHLTLMFDPGRLKRGVAPHEVAGSPMRAGRAYTLVIDAIPTAGGGRSSPSRTRWLATAPDRRPPAPATWQLGVPRRGTTEPLTVVAEPDLDVRLVGRLVRVEDTAGVFVEGSFDTADGGAGMTFTPAHPWSAASHRLVIDARLEDHAGNRVGRPFEARPGASEHTEATLVRTFHTAAAADPGPVDPHAAEP